MSTTHAVYADFPNYLARTATANQAADVQSPSVLVRLTVNAGIGIGALLRAVIADPPGASGVLAAH